MRTFNIQIIFESDTVAGITIPLIKKQFEGFEDKNGIKVLYGEE